jgi:hypothetical protein
MQVLARYRNRVVWHENVQETKDKDKGFKLTTSRTPIICVVKCKLAFKYTYNMNSVRCETSRHVRNKKKEYLKDKVNDLAMNSKNKNFKDLYRRINGFKRSYQPRSNLVKDENGDLLADFHVLSRWKNYFSHLLIVHNVSDVRQIEIHTAEPLVSDPSHLEVEVAIAKLKSINLQVKIKFWQNWFKQEVKR